MGSTKKLAAATVVAVLVSAGVALAAIAPTNTFKGNAKWYNASQKASEKFLVTATFKKGKLTALKGQGNPGVIPYNSDLSTSTYCGAANVYDGTGVRITEGTAPKGFDWLFKVQPKQTSGFGWYTVTLAGKWVSSSKASTEIRFLQHNLPDKGKCDSGQLPLTLKSS